MVKHLQHPFSKAVTDLIGRQRSRKHLPLRRAADRARDTKNWRDASEIYAQYLDLVPDDAPIWVQLGHAQKEYGDLNRAETAYLRALSLMRNDADLHLQLGHLFKLQGRRGDAAQNYANSLELNPTAAAYGELVGMGETLFANQVLNKTNNRLPPATYFQVGDMLNYLITHKTPSGIQRVQIGIIKYISSLGKAEAARYRFVHSDFGGDRLFLLDSDKLQAVVSYVTQARVDHHVLRGLIQEVTSATPPLALGKDDTFIVLGAFWGQFGYTDALRSLKLQGVKVGLYFYDLIPITHPEFVEISLSEAFSQAYIEILHFADFGLSISDYTKQELFRFVEKNGMRRIPVETVQLAHGIDLSLAAPIQLDREWSDAIYDMKGTRYVLFVSTIEIRKNHRYLFDIWKMLMNEGVDVPTLLFVGRRGWRVDDLYAQLEATNYLDGKIKILHDLSDSELSCLYRHCLFTTFPSFVEGWGLPIGESLSYGKVCVTSSESAMPEVAGDLVQYVDPLNTRAGLAVFRDLMTKPEGIKRWEAGIAGSFQARDWGDVSKDFLRITSSLIAELPKQNAPPFVPELAAGTIFFAGLTKEKAGKISGNIRDRAQRLILLTYWHAPEDQGTRMSGVEGSISLRTDIGGNRAVKGILQIRASDTLRDGTLAIHAADMAPQLHPLSAGTEHIIHFNAQTDETGGLTIRLRVSRSSNGFGKGDVMLCTFGYTVANDAAAWSDLLENAIQFNVSRVAKKTRLTHSPR